MQACENYSDYNSFIPLQETGSLLLVLKVNLLKPHYAQFFRSKSCEYVTQKYPGETKKAS